MYAESNPSSQSLALCSHSRFLILTFLLIIFAAGKAVCIPPASLERYSPLKPLTLDVNLSRVYVDLKGIKGFGVREFNRVDGFTIYYGLTIGGRFEETDPQLDATALYYTDRSRLGWILDFHKSFERLGYSTIGLTYCRVTDTYDRWRMGDLESSLASFVLKESFRNYYEREGLSVYLTTEVADWFSFRVSYTGEDHKSVVAGNPFTIPGDAKEFRDNPMIDDGRFGALTFTFTYDSRDNIRLPHIGWYHEGIVEVSRNWLRSDFSYTRWFIQMRRYHPLRFGQFVNLRLAVAGSSGHILRQRLLTAGGVGTLRGYDDLSLVGDHMVLANAEYRFPIGLLHFKPVLFLFNELHGMLFFDAGKIWFKDLEDDAEFLSDVGVGLSGANLMSYFGVYLAWPLNGDNEGARLTIKIQRDF